MGATPDNISRIHNLSVNAATPAGPSLSSVSFVPTSIVAGQNATGTVRFSGAMSQGAVVQLSSSNPAVARVPQETVVSANTSTSTFNLATSATTTATPVTITARWFGVTRTTTITVKPGTPPAADTVKITKATWKQGLLTIEATGSNPNAILSVYSSAGSFLFDLTNKGGGRYADQRGFITNPRADLGAQQLRRLGQRRAEELGEHAYWCLTTSTEISTAGSVPLFSSQWRVFRSSGQPTPGPYSVAIPSRWSVIVPRST